ncbi:MAG: FHA domain-containing protein [Pyrinomonadaceae bacterium]|jgi:pSer/pThr/pTyr-binding forkhead associated (FHA) protein|nr:FHA domain-containing protein [Pyrinomonadaceae bacterium]
MSVLDKVRRWIDGDSAETVLEQAARDAQVKPRSVSEEFIVKLARAVEETMQREMVPLPQGTVMIPTEYIIFLSEEDDKDWQGVKRKGLEQGLYHILAERAKEISGKKKLETQSFAVELRVDGTLEKGEVRVQHSWEETNAHKTSVLARGKAQLPSQNQTAKPVTPIQQPIIQQPIQQIPVVPASPYNQPPPTIQQNFNESLNQSQDVEEMTRLQSRQVEYYKLEIWRGGVRQNLIPIYQKEISVGRGSKSKPVDVPLAGDPEISRRHLTINLDLQGSFWVLNEGRNPTMIANREVPMGQRIQVKSGDYITVCSYLLRIQ